MYDDEGRSPSPASIWNSVGSDWTELHPARRGEEGVDKRARGGREATKEEEDHFEYIVEAVRIVRPEGTRQLNVRCSRH